ncbi:hypothetical protein ACOSP7_025015 [Xanthoceras sorbifolium]
MIFFQQQQRMQKMWNFRTKRSLFSISFWVSKEKKIVTVNVSLYIYVRMCQLLCRVGERETQRKEKDRELQFFFFFFETQRTTVVCWWKGVRRTMSGLCNSLSMT